MLNRRDLSGYDGATLRSWIDAVLTEIGPRESCSAAERALAERLADEWQGLGFRVQRHTFRCCPRAFLGTVPMAAALYLLGAAGLALGLGWATAAVLFGLSAVILVAEVLFYCELTDPLFAAKEGVNIVGRIAPRGEVTRRVVVSAHMDSAYEFNLWYWFKNAAIPIMTLGFLAPVFACGVSALAAFAAISASWPLIAIVALSPIQVLHLVWHTYRLVPGAMDDLAGVSVLVGLGRALARAREDGTLPAQTEVLLLGASSEEAGLRGMKRYVADHEDELKRIPTFGLFVDGVYDERHLTIVSRELLVRAKHDPRLVGIARACAAELGYEARTGWIPLGASDGATFARAGISSLALLCQDNTQLVPNYHTRLDTLEHVRPESIDTMLSLVRAMIDRLDKA
jgi:hypothetical protein